MEMAEMYFSELSQDREKWIIYVRMISLLGHN